MKMKSLILGAAGIMAATGAQAADLPVAPEPVDYVRVCDAYGSGFYYIPGTETCLRVGGGIRAEYRVWDYDTNYRFNRRFGAAVNQGPTTSTRARAYVRLDSRTNTEFGLLRTYLDVWFTGDSYGGTSGTTVTLWNAFIQLGGLTAGRATSFFDFYTGDTFESVIDLAQSDRKTNLLAYTAAFGNGFSASVSLEDGTFRAHGIGVPALVPVVGNGYGWHRFPDLVANLRVDQGWGSAQVMGALHDVRDAYAFGGDDSEVGFAIGAGATFNLPMIAPGDSVSFQVAYADGATDYLAPDVGLDGYYRGNGTIATVTGWSASGGFTHFWTPEVASSFTASYVDIDNPAIGASDFDQWDIQANIKWMPVSGLTIGAEIEYEDTNFAVGPDSDRWVGLFRIQRMF
ncbi:MAG: porin [Hyphomicrobiales bacterium]|nr:MAG: porin [Hyphomicrobiales bacterium]